MLRCVGRGPRKEDDIGTGYREGVVSAANRLAGMKVETESASLTNFDSELTVVGLFEDEALPDQMEGEPGASEAKGKAKSSALIHPRDSWSGDSQSGPRRVLAVGLGKRGDLSAEGLRVAAAIAAKEARRMDLRELAWMLPGDENVTPQAAAAAIVAGTILTDWRFDRFRSKDDDAIEKPEKIEALTLLIDAELLGDEVTTPAEIEAIAAAAEIERVAATAQNRARDLQSLPGNHLTPTALAERAAEIAAQFDSVKDETLTPAEITALGMGGMLAVSRGSDEEPRLIVLRYTGAGSDAPTLGIVGKSVTFDTGGISLKPPASMHEMKMDMSGGAATIEAVAAIAELGLPVNLVAVMPSVENMPSGSAIKPGDIITQYNGKTVEVNNTDAEGRLILADALAYCAEQGVERIVDLATLTGAVLIALGSTYAALIANDDEWAEAVAAAGEEAGELAWRLPLHEEYKQLTKGTVADLSNSSMKRKAGTIYAGSFLEEFVGKTPWAHLDIAGTAWDTGREYLGNGPSGYGVRLLINLAGALGSRSA